MILKGNARAGGANLARHLMNARDNDSVELAEVRGFVADDLRGAFAETEAISTGTKCKEYLYSLSINPNDPLTRDQYDHAINKIERKLGLTDQPRAVVYHVKEGREHCHVVWSRIDGDNMKAIHNSFDRQKLRQASRELARDFGHDLPKGLEQDQGADRFKDRYNDQSYAEIGQAERSGLSPFDRKQAVTAAYQQADGLAAFQSALSEHGMMLAGGDKVNRKGQRTPVIIDRAGEVYGLRQNLDGVRAKEIRTNLKLDGADLPTVQEAKEILAERLRQTAQEKPRDTFDAVQRVEDARKHLDALTAAQKAELKALKGNHQEQLKGIRDGEAIALKLTEKRMKEAYRPEWRTLYLIQKDEVDAVHKMISTPMQRVKALLRGQAGDAFDFENRNTLAGAFRFIIKGEADLKKMEKRHAQERKDLGDNMRVALREERREIKAETVDNRREAKADYDRDLGAYKRDHTWERQKAEKALNVAETALDKARIAPQVERPIVHPNDMTKTSKARTVPRTTVQTDRAIVHPNDMPKDAFKRPSPQPKADLSKTADRRSPEKTPVRSDPTVAAKDMKKAAQKRRAEDQAVMKSAKDAAKQAGVDRRDAAPVQDAKATATRDQKPQREETRAEKRARYEKQAREQVAKEKTRGNDLGRTR